MSELCIRSDPSLFALRPTLPGDICILLSTDDVQEISHIRELQSNAQKVFGGQPAPLVHLTSQRFQTPNPSEREQNLQTLSQVLRKSCQSFQPFPLIAIANVPLFVPFEDQNVLKWCIQTSPQLHSLIQNQLWALHQSGLQSLYRTWFIPNLITALKCIPSLDIPSSDAQAGFPQSLFMIRKLQLSEVQGQNSFNILDTFFLGR